MINLTYKEQQKNKNKDRKQQFEKTGKSKLSYIS